MTCPQCHQDVAPETFTCPHCNANLGLVRAVERLRQNLLHSQAILQTQYQQISNSLDEIIRSSVPSSPVPPRMIPEPTPHTVISSTPPPLPPPLPPSWPSSSESSFPDSFAQSMESATEIHFGQKWLLGVGILTVLLGIGYFLKYAFDQNWISPLTRVLLAYVVGVVFGACGEVARQKSYRNFGLSLIGTGIGVFYCSTFAAFQVYHLFSQSAAFTGMVVITLATIGLSLYYDAIALAIFAALGGFLTPMVLGDGQSHIWVLFPYLTLLNLIVLATSFFKRWLPLHYLGFISTWVIFTAWYSSNYSMDYFAVTLGFLQIFFLIYTMAPFVHAAESEEEEFGPFALTLLNSFFSFGFSYAMISNHSRSSDASYISLAYAALFFSLAVWVYRFRGEKSFSFTLLLGQGIAFLALTIPLLFSGSWITLFWAVEAAVLFWVALRLANTWMYGLGCAILLMALGKLFLYDYTQLFPISRFGFYFEGEYPAQIFSRWLSSLSIIAGFALAGSAHLQPTTPEELKPARKIFYGVAAFVFFVFLNLEISTFFHAYMDNARFAAISVLWTLFSLGLISLGFFYRSQGLRLTAILLFFFTVLKVFLFDLSNVATPYRIISFIVLGLILIGASFLYYRFKDRLDFQPEPPPLP